MNLDVWFFVVNPRAGGGRVEKSWPRLREHLEKESMAYEFSLTTKQGEAYDIVKHALNLGYRKIVAVGGDGTLNESVNALMNQPEAVFKQCVLSVIPWGTGNDWAAFHNINAGLPECVLVLQQPKLIEQDVGCVHYQEAGVEKQRWFMNFVGAGMDSYVLENLRAGGGSRLNYSIVALKGLLHYRSPKFKVSLNDQHQVLRSLMLLVCNGKFGGGGMIFAPEAKMNDGKLNYLSIADMSVLRRIFSFIYLFTGRINKHPAVITKEISEITISADEAIIFQCDGELIGELPIRVECQQAQQLIIAV